jgi:hypothetical protein
MPETRDFSDVGWFPLCPGSFVTIFCRNYKLLILIIMPDILLSAQVATRRLITKKGLA